MDEALFDIAKGLATALVRAAGRRVRDEALGEPQERALRNIFGEATAVMLVEAARRNREDQGLPDRLADQFRIFYSDTWVAETLVGVALSKEEPPYEKLQRRFEELGLDPNAVPMDLDEAMRLLIYELADRLRKEASRAGSPLNNLVQVSELGVIRERLDELVRGFKTNTERLASPEEISGHDNERFEEYECGPQGAEHDILFAGFFLPSGLEGNLTSGGASRAYERQFIEIFRRELDDHRINTSKIELGGAVLPLRALDYRPPSGYAGRHDHESFSEVTKGLAEHTLGVLWGTVSEGGNLQSFEVIVNPDRFYGGPSALMAFSSVKRLVDREDLPSRVRIVFAAQAMAALWGQSYCAELDNRGLYAESYRVASDSRRLVEQALEDLRRELGTTDTAAIEEQRRGLLPQIIRQEASSLWRRGEEREALARLLDALEIWPYGPLSGRNEFREYSEAEYAFGLANHVESFEQFLAENYENGAKLQRDLARQYVDRAFVGLPPVDLSLFLWWVQEAFKRGIDVEEDVESWFTELAAVHPEEPFVIAAWGEARRAVAVQKYGAGYGSPSSWRMDKAREKFEEAYRMDPDIPYFAARVQAIGFTAALAFAATDEGRQRFDEAASWWEKAKPYHREHAPWALEPGTLDTPEQLGRWVGEEHGKRDTD